MEARESHGRATFDGERLDARDEAPADLIDAARALAEAARAQLLANIQGATSARFVVSVRAVGEARREETLYELTRSGRSVVSTPEFLALDAALLASLPCDELAPAPHALPSAIVWRNGSAAVLLHEAVGHASECGATPLSWPAWLEVRDVPSFEFDDAGQMARGANLLEQPPRNRRRETFRDVPLPRMCGVHVAAKGDEIELAELRLEVELVGGGTYDPVADEVTLRITAATLFDGPSSTALRPFLFTAQRSEIAAAIRACAGPPVRYPGVICSREGQDVYVSSHAPDLLTVFA